MTPLRLEVDAAVAALRPDFIALAVQLSGLGNGPGTADSERRLAEAEAFARAAGPSIHPHIAAWREAFRAFGASDVMDCATPDEAPRHAFGGCINDVDRFGAIEETLRSLYRHCEP